MFRFRYSLFAFILATLATVSLAQTKPDTRKWTTGTIPASQDACEIEIKLADGVVAPGGKTTLTVTLTPKGDYHLYEFRADGKSRSTSGLPILLALTTTPKLTIAPPTPSADPHAEESVLGGKDYVYHDPVTFTFTIDVPADQPAGEMTFLGGVGVQLCEGENCKPPEGYEFRGKLTIGTEKAAAAPIEWVKSGQKAVKDLMKQGAAGTTNAPNTGNPNKTTLDGDSPVPSKSETAVAQLPSWEIRTVGGDITSLFAALGFALIGGFILNFMPCVLPVIGLKILSFVDQAGKNRGQILMLNLVYVAGMLSVFLVLGMISAAPSAAATTETAKGWGTQFQKAWFNITMIGVIFSMALSFLGIWEIPIPGFATSKTLTQASKNHGLSGAFVKGMVTTLLATPCSGPFLGAVLAYTTKLPPWQTMLIFTTVGVGMGIPYLLIGAFPSLIRFLPKPGAWMDTFKNLMGFLLLGTVLILFMNLKPEYFTPTLALMFGLWFMFWWIGRVPIYDPLSTKLKAWLLGGAVAGAVGWIAFVGLAGGKSDSELAWQDYSPERLIAATSSGKTVLVDITANWCPNCKINLLTSINRAGVKDIVERYGVVPIKADWSKEDDPYVTALVNNLGSNSIPILAVFPAGDPTRPIVLRDLVSQEDVINLIKEAGPSKKETSPVVNTAQPNQTTALD